MRSERIAHTTKELGVYLRQRFTEMLCLAIYIAEVEGHMSDVNLPSESFDDHVANLEYCILEVFAKNIDVICELLDMLDRVTYGIADNKRSITACHPQVRHASRARNQKALAKLSHHPKAMRIVVN